MVPASVPLVQVHQSGTGWLEATGAVVERGQVIFEVHVQVLAARCLGAAPCVIDQPGADALASCHSRDHSVLQPCVDKAIPEDVDESDEDSAVAATTQPRLCWCTSSTQFHSDSSNTLVPKASACSRLTS